MNILKNFLNLTVYKTRSFRVDPRYGLRREDAETMLRVRGWTPERDLGEAMVAVLREECDYHGVPIHDQARAFVRCYNDLVVNLHIPVNARDTLDNGIDLDCTLAHHAYEPRILGQVMADHNLVLCPIGYSYGATRALVIDSHGHIYEYYEWDDPTKGDPYLSQPYDDIFEYLRACACVIPSAKKVWITIPQL